MIRASFYCSYSILECIEHKAADVISRTNKNIGRIRVTRHKDILQIITVLVLETSKIVTLVDSEDPDEMPLGSALFTKTKTIIYRADLG